MRKAFGVFLVCVSLVATSASAEGRFTLADYKSLKIEDNDTAELVLRAMREAIFYGQESVGEPVVCASPIPIADERLAELLDAELASPTNIRGREYVDGDQVAFVLLHALKKQGSCK